MQIPSTTGALIRLLSGLPADTPIYDTTGGDVTIHLPGPGSRYRVVYICGIGQDAEPPDPKLAADPTDPHLADRVQKLERLMVEVQGELHRYPSRHMPVAYPRELFAPKAVTIGQGLPPPSMP